MPILLILALIVAILAVLFAVQNTQAITVSLLLWEFEQPLALILLIVLALGVLIGLLATSPGMIRRSFTVSGQKKKIDALEKDLQQQKIELAQTKQTLEEMSKQPEEQEQAEKT